MGSEMCIRDSQRRVRFFGTLSYSLYLVHQVVIHVMLENLPAPHVVRAALALAISLLLSLAIWRYIEKPLAKLRSKLTTAPPSATALQAQGSS